jgi:hypothetical protein
LRDAVGRTRDCSERVANGYCAPHREDTEPPGSKALAECFGEIAPSRFVEFLVWLLEVHVARNRQQAGRWGVETERD